jgi:hypothetical protein
MIPINMNSNQVEFPANILNCKLEKMPLKYLDLNLNVKKTTFFLFV